MSTNVSLIVKALLQKRENVAMDIIRSKHAKISLMSSLLPTERYQLHQDLVERINFALKEWNFEIIRGFFPRGIAKEESLAEEFRDWRGDAPVIGWGPKELALKITFSSGQETQDLSSKKDIRGVSICSVFFFEGDDSDDLPTGVYLRRQSNSGRHDYLALLSNAHVQLFDPASCPIEGEIGIFNYKMVKAFRAVADVELANSQLSDDEEWQALPDPWQQLAAWKVEQARDDDDEDEERYLGASTLAKLKNAKSLFDNDED